MLTNFLPYASIAKYTLQVYSIEWTHQLELDWKMRSELFGYLDTWGTSF